MRSRPAHPSSISVLLAVLLLSPSLRSQQTAPTPQTIEDALRQMSDLAGVIFVGQVTAVRPRPGQSGASGIVEVDFRVDQAIRGCSSGTIYTLREWAGLWESTDERYRPGQTLLMMLHTPNSAGISSPVGGMHGAIPVRAGGSATSETTATTTVTTTPPPPIVDLRWVGTRTLRAIPYAPDTPTVTIRQSFALPLQPATGSVSDTSVAAQQAPVSTIASMLSTWKQDTSQISNPQGAR